MKDNEKNRAKRREQKEMKNKTRVEAGSRGTVTARQPGTSVGSLVTTAPEHVFTFPHPPRWVDLHSVLALLNHQPRPSISLFDLFQYLFSRCMFVGLVDCNKLWHRL